jgi:electron transfer flavoprotein alpha subunit
MTNNVFVWVDQSGGMADTIAWEVIGAGRQIAGALGGEVVACVLGDGVDALAQTASQRGADKAILVNDATLTAYRLEAYATTLVKLAQEHRPAVFLMGASSRARKISQCNALPSRRQASRTSASTSSRRAAAQA